MVNINVSKIPPKLCPCGRKFSVITEGRFGPLYKCPRCGEKASIAESDRREALLAMNLSLNCVCRAFPTFLGQNLRDPNAPYLESVLSATTPKRRQTAVTRRQWLPSVPMSC